MLYETFGELKYKYRNREFWCKGDYVDTVGKNEKRISEYASHQLEADRLGEQLTISGTSPFRSKK
jgi:putative transposase